MAVLAAAFMFVILTAAAALADETWTVKVDSGYLALRTAKAFDYNNEIGKLYTGDTVQVQDKSDSTYWWVYSSKYGRNGYVNRNYLVNSAVTSGTTMTVSVQSGYLALRTAKAFDYNNEIGQLYTGDTVQVQDTSDSTYWWVYSPKYGRNGYVNRNYLVGAAAPAPSSSAPTSYETWTVKVDSGYLALRTAKAFDYNNEIGKLYTGDTVQVTDKSDSTYWYGYSPKIGRYGYMNRNYLTGGPSQPSTGGTTMTVSVQSGYLALRTAKAFDYNNEIGQLYTGDTVQVQDTSDPTYWWVYSPKYGKNGYVNRNYLVGSAPSSNSNNYPTRTVRVQSGYLALRTAKAFDYNNEIGQLYTGDTVQVIDSSDGTYWWVYSPKYGKNGYVNRNYLY